MHSDVMMNQTVIAALAAKIIEMAKNSQSIPWVGQHTKAANRWLSVLIALATTAGFEFAWSGSMTSGGVLTIAIPSAEHLIEFAMHAGYSFLIQEATYRGVIEK